MIIPEVFFSVVLGYHFIVLVMDIFTVGVFIALWEMRCILMVTYCIKTLIDKVKKISGFV